MSSTARALDAGPSWRSTRRHQRRSAASVGATSATAAASSSGSRTSSRNAPATSAPLMPGSMALLDPRRDETWRGVCDGSHRESRFEMTLEASRPPRRRQRVAAASAAPRADRRARFEAAGRCADAQSRGAAHRPSAGTSGCLLERVLQLLEFKGDLRVQPRHPSAGRQRPVPGRDHGPSTLERVGSELDSRVP